MKELIHTRPVEMKKILGGGGGGGYELLNIVGRKKIFHFKSSKTARKT